MPPVTASHVVDVDARNFQKEVIDRSKEVPVFVLFWAEQIAPSLDSKRVLERLAEASGKFRLARVDVARDPTLAQHLRVQNLPSIKVVVDGGMADELEGPQGEHVLADLVDRHTMSSGEMIRAQLADLIARRDFRTAHALLTRALEEEPHNPVFKVELADVLAQTGALDEARALLVGVPAESEDRERPQTRIELLEEVKPLPELAALQARSTDLADLDARYELALRLAASGEYEQAFAAALDLLKTNRLYRDELARRTLVRLFQLLPKGNELVKRYRRQMFNLLH